MPSVGDSYRTTETVRFECECCRSGSVCSDLPDTLFAEVTGGCLDGMSLTLHRILGQVGPTGDVIPATVARWIAVPNTLLEACETFQHDAPCASLPPAPIFGTVVATCSGGCLTIEVVYGPVATAGGSYPDPCGPAYWRTTGGDVEILLGLTSHINSGSGSGCCGTPPDNLIQRPLECTHPMNLATDLLECDCGGPVTSVTITE